MIRYDLFKLHFSEVVEHLTRKPKVTGLKPAAGTRGLYYKASVLS
jgi:hypothetical protein